jgi:hypothetical protein
LSRNSIRPSLGFRSRRRTWRPSLSGGRAFAGISYVFAFNYRNNRSITLLQKAFRALKVSDDLPESTQVDAFVEAAVAAFKDVNEDEWLSWGAEIMPLQAETLAERERARKAREEEEMEAERVRKEEAEQAEEAARLEEATQNVADRLVQGLISGDNLDRAIAAEVRLLERKARRGSQAPSLSVLDDYEGETAQPENSGKKELRKRPNNVLVEIPVDEKRKESKGKKSERPFASLQDIPVNEVRNIFHH